MTSKVIVARIPLIVLIGILHGNLVAQIANPEFRKWENDRPQGWNISLFPDDAAHLIHLRRLENERSGLEVKIDGNDIAVTLFQLANAFTPEAKYKCKVLFDSSEFSGKGWLIFETQDQPTFGELHFNNGTEEGDGWMMVEEEFSMPDSMEGVSLHLRFHGVGVYRIQKIEIERTN